jgi:CBS domain-containing protein
METKQAGSKQDTPAGHDDLANIPVASIMTPDPTTVKANASIRVAVQTLIEKRITGVPVVDDHNNLVGVVSENDLLLLAASGRMSRALQYTKEPDFLQADATLKEALIKMIKCKRKWFPVLDDKKKIVGVIARCDLLKALLEQENA